MLFVDSDLIFSTVCVPFIAYHYAADNWTIGSITCKLSQYLTYVTTYVTVYTLVAVAIVRVCKVTLTTGRSGDERHQPINITSGGCCHGHIRKVTLVVGALWIIALAANLPVIFSYRIKTYISALNASDIEPYKYCGNYKYINIILSYHIVNLKRQNRPVSKLEQISLS